MIENIEMTFFEEFFACVIWFCVFAPMLYGPFIMLYIYIYYSFKVFIGIVAILASISMLPSAFNKSVCYRYAISVVLKYFSHRGLWTEYLPTDKPCIIVGKKHVD
jgi:hypothetical protein